MPRGQKGFNSGGRRRTIVCPCGYRIIGDPVRQGMIERLHKKKCDTCRECVSVSNTPFTTTPNVVDLGNTGNYRETPAMIRTTNGIDGKIMEHAVQGIPDLATCDPDLLNLVAQLSKDAEGVEVQEKKKKKKKRKKKKKQEEKKDEE